MPNQEEQELTLDRALWYGRMCRAHSASTAEETSPQFLKRLQKSQTKKSPTFLCLRTGGLIQDASWEEDSALLGEFSTRSFLEYHNGGVESRLSQILQGGQLRKYYLSDAAKMGILRRANRRGKELPILLQEALQSKSTRPHSADEAPTITESDVSPTLNTFDCGEERVSTFVCIPEVSRTLSARHDSSPCIDRGQEFVCYESE